MKIFSLPNTIGTATESPTIRSIVELKTDCLNKKKEILQHLSIQHLRSFCSNYVPIAFWCFHELNLKSKVIECDKVIRR